jgi:hypothetical protein
MAGLASAFSGRSRFAEQPNGNAISNCVARRVRRIRAGKRVRPEIGTRAVRVVGDLGKSRNWESRKQKWGRTGAAWLGSRYQAGNDLSAVSPVDAEIRIGGDDHRIGQGFAHAHQAGVSQAHGHAGVPGAKVEHLA